MPKMVVNTDAYTLAIPNQAPNQAPVARTLRRGEVVEVSDEEARRGTSITVTNHYRVGTVTVPRSEPSLLPAEEAPDHATAAINAVAESRTEALLRELAAVSATLPPERLDEIAANVMPERDPGVPTVYNDETLSGEYATTDGTPVVTTRPEEPPAPAPPAPPAPPAAAPDAPPVPPAPTKATGTTKKPAPGPQR